LQLGVYPAAEAVRLPDEFPVFRRRRPPELKHGHIDLVEAVNVILELDTLSDCLDVLRKGEGYKDNYRTKDYRHSGYHN